MPDLTNTDRKRLAGYLHTANFIVVSVKRGEMDNTTHPEQIQSASDLIKQVMSELMDAPGMTDFYGNPTARDDSYHATQPDGWSQAELDAAKDNHPEGEWPNHCGDYTGGIR